MSGPDESILFDVWIGRTPRAEFGAIRDVGPDFDAYILQVYQQISEIFGDSLSPETDTPVKLDELINSMWAGGWSPANDSPVPFIRDFGLVLASWLHKSLGGRLLSRGDQAIMHLSLWWQGAGVEAFPGHAIAKRLAESDSGISITSFADGVRSRILAL